MNLTERQREVLRLAANGYSNKRIARGLCLSESAVHDHFWCAYCRLGMWGEGSRLRAAIWLLDREHKAWR